MIAGDFNETLKEIDRRSNSSKTKYQTVNSLITSLKTNDLIDIWRELNSNKRQFTWRRKDKSQASRIDYILVNTNFKSRINWCKIKPVCIKYTDHQSVFLNFLSSVEEKGKGFQCFFLKISLAPLVVSLLSD
jgi:exonuclease III